MDNTEKNCWRKLDFLGGKNKIQQQVHDLHKDHSIGRYPLSLLHYQCSPCDCESITGLGLNPARGDAVFFIPCSLKTEEYILTMVSL